jgi:hypothetical protein
MDIIFRNADQETVDKVIAALGDNVEVTASTWTQEYASEYIGALRWSTHGLVRQVVHAGGRLDARVLRGADGQGSLRGVTGPLRKAMRRLVAQGKLPPGLPVPVEPDYDNTAGTSWQRTPGFKMPPELVPLFAAAFMQRTAELRPQPDSDNG